MSIEGKVESSEILQGAITTVPLIDKTLTKTGECADAKAVGDRFQEQEMYFNQVISETETDINKGIGRLETNINATIENKTNSLNNKIDEEIARSQQAEESISQRVAELDTNLNDTITSKFDSAMDVTTEHGTRLDTLEQTVAENSETFSGGLEEVGTRLNELEMAVDVSVEKPVLKIIKTDNATNYDDSKNTFIPFIGTFDEEIKDNTGLLSYSQLVVDVGDRTGVTAHGILVGYGVSRVRVTASVRYQNKSSSNTVLHTYLNVIRKDGTEVIRQGVASDTINSYQTQTIDTVIDVFDGDFIFLNSYKATAGRDIDVISDYNGTYLIVEALEVFGDE